jgi:ferric-dicitrate binding protein FerR (iron transport regulator)
MMRCEGFLEQLNARFDGELGAEDAAALDAHLAECAECRAAAERLHAIDTELRLAFGARRAAAARLAERTAAVIRASAEVPKSPAPGLAWGQLLLAMTAGFLLAVVVFQPWRPKTVAPALVPLEPIARLAVASGPVEVRPASQADFLRCSPDAPLEQDSTVRTSQDVFCEIALQDGSPFWLDRNTEVTLRKSKVVEVRRGRLWSCCLPGQKSFEIQSGGGTIVPNVAAELALECRPDAVRLLVVDGTVSVQTGHQSMEVGPGQQVRITGGKLEEEPGWHDALLETAWVNKVLALRSAERPELAERVNRLLANVGAAKLSLLYEDELRRLGDSGVPPLLAYLNSTRPMPDGAQRATAARMIADVAQSRWIADLIALLTDPNPDVRFHAARGLERLTGRDQGCEARRWRTEPWTSCGDAYQKWIYWWLENRDRYPAARRDIPTPKSPPF